MSAVENKTHVDADRIRPGILRTPTVQFSEADNGEPHHSSANAPSNSGPAIAAMKARTGTEETEASKASSKLDARWRPQTVLSFDGGGIRGYSSLLILQQIMKAVREIEVKEDDTVDSSFFPGAFVPPHNKKSPTPSDDSRSDEPKTSEDSQRPSRFLPCHYFDYIGGTSTGGLIAIMLGRLRMGVDECLEEYETFGSEIFGHPRWFSMRGPLPAFKEKYNGKRLQCAVESVVENRSSPEQKAVGAGYFGSARELCKTIVVAYHWMDESSAPRYGTEAVDRVATPGAPQAPATDTGAYLFRSYDHWGTRNKKGKPNIFERNPGPADNIPIWQVARATTAAPTYFDPIPIQNNIFGDGGLGSNNPVQEIFWEVATMHGNDGSVMDLIVSIGTGQADHVKLHSSGPKKLLSYVNATKALATESEQKHAAMEALIEVANLENVHYERFNLPREQGLKNMKLDEWKKKGSLRITKRGIKFRKESTLEKIRRLTMDYCETDQVQKDIYEVARKLVAHRKARCSDPRKWELWATGIRYRCTEKRCDKSQKLRPSREDLIHHILKIHPEGFKGKTEEQISKLLEEKVRRGTCPY